MAARWLGWDPPKPWGGCDLVVSWLKERKQEKKEGRTQAKNGGVRGVGPLAVVEMRTCSSFFESPMGSSILTQTVSCPRQDPMAASCLECGTLGIVEMLGSQTYLFAPSFPGKITGR